MSKTVWFVLALLVQVGILAAIPLQETAARLGGTTILLDAQARWPEGSVTGYQVKLRYDVTDIVSDDELRMLAEGTWLYLILAPDTTGIWQAVNYQMLPPRTLGPDRRFIAAQKQGHRLAMGIETYYVPEGVVAALREALEESARRVTAEVDVSPAGSAAVKMLYVGDRAY